MSFSRLDRLTRPGAVLASNTSSLRISEIAQATLHPERVVGLHFFNPCPKMPLVEIVRGPLSDDSSLATALALTGRIGKTPVLVSDARDFGESHPRAIPGRGAGDRGRKACRSSPSMKRRKSGGMPMGPFSSFLDEIGLDIAAHVLKSLAGAAPAPQNVIKCFRCGAPIASGWERRAARDFFTFMRRSGRSMKKLTRTLSGGAQAAHRSTLNQSNGGSCCRWRTRRRGLSKRA